MSEYRFQERKDRIQKRIFGHSQQKQQIIEQVLQKVGDDEHLLSVLENTHYIRPETRQHISDIILDGSRIASLSRILEIENILLEKTVIRHEKACHIVLVEAMGIASTM